KSSFPPAKVAAETSKECQAASAGKSRASLREAACMIAAGHPTYVRAPDEFFAGGHLVPLTIQRAGGDSDAILTDLLACEAVAVEAQEPAHVRTGKIASALVGGWLSNLGWAAHDAKIAEKVLRQYTACMEPRGYAVYFWAPAPANPATAEQ